MELSRTHHEEVGRGRGLMEVEESDKNKWKAIVGYEERAIGKGKGQW